MTKEQIEKAEERLAKMGIEKNVVIEMDEDDYKGWASKFLKAQKTEAAVIAVSSMIAVMNGWRA